MFNDLLDQPRRELEAVKAKCEALQLECAEQKGRIQELETRMEKQKKCIVKLDALAATQEQTIFQFDAKINLLRKQHVQIFDRYESKFKQLDEHYVNQRTLNLVRSIRASYHPQVVYEGMLINNGGPLQYCGRTFFKNSVYVHVGVDSTVSIQGTGDRVEILMFQGASVDLKDFGAQEGDWKLFVKTPVEFVGSPFEGAEGQKLIVYHRFVEGIEAQWSLKLPPAPLYIFK